MNWNTGFRQASITISSTRRLIWIGILPLILAAAFLIAGVTVSPKERQGPLKMFRGGYGARLTPEQDAELLEKLRNEGFNVPTAMLEQARQQASSAGIRRTIARVLYTLAGISFLAGGIGFHYSGGFAFLKKQLKQDHSPSSSSV